MAKYKSEITGEVYEGEMSSYYDSNEDQTQLYIGEALVQEIAGCLDSDEVDEYFSDYYVLLIEQVMASQDISIMPQEEITQEPTGSEDTLSNLDILYPLWEKAQVILVDGVASQDISLTSVEEIDQELEDGEDPIVLSVYGKYNDGCPFEFYLDASNINDGKLDKNMVLTSKRGETISVLSPCVKTENILIYTIQQYDTHFNDMCAEFGHFTDRDKAIKAMMNGFEELYPGFKDDVYANGDNQWITDEFDFGVVIVEIEVNNTFCEQ